MAQVIQRTPNIGELFGTGLGAGIGGSLNKLAEMKLNQLQQRQQAGAYQQLGLPAHLADALSQISPQERFDIFQRLRPEDFNQQEPQSGIQALQQQSPQNPSIQQPMSGQQALQQSVPQQRNAASILSRPSPKEQTAIDKETLKYFTEIQDKALAAKTTGPTLNEFEQLIKSGNLPGAGSSSIYELLKNIKIKAPRILTPAGQRFEQVAATNVAGVKGLFGGRVTNFDLQKYLEKFPTLLQDDNVKIAAVNAIRSENEEALVREQALNDIIRENGGVRPRNIREMVEQRVAPQIEKLNAQRVESVNELLNSTQGQILKDLPSASTVPGMEVRRKDGTLLRSDGKKWNKVTK